MPKNPIVTYHRLQQYIDAPADVIYEMLANLKEWPSWQSGVKMLRHPPDEAKPKEKFRWSNAGMVIESEVTTAKKPIEISWSSRSMWIKAFIQWQLQPESSGTTILYEQSLEGFGSKLMKHKLEKSMENTLMELKKYAELKVTC